MVTWIHARSFLKTQSRVWAASPNPRRCGLDGSHSKGGERCAQGKGKRQIYDFIV